MTYTSCRSWKAALDGQLKVAEGADFEMYQPEYQKPAEPGQIKFLGDILNGIKNIRQELDIADRNQLKSNIERGIQKPLDPVTASHLHWGYLRRNKPNSD